MSDRGEWDPWDFGDPEDDAWDEPDDGLDGSDPAGVDAAEPTVVGAQPWEEGAGDEPPEGGPPRGALLAALGVMLVLAVAIAAVVIRGGDDDDDGDGDETASEVETDDKVSSTSSSSTTSTTSTTVVEGGDAAAEVPSDASTSTTARRGTGTTRPPAASTTTTQPDDGKTPKCASAGGGDPKPVEGGRPNDPLRLSLCIDDATPAVGQRVTVYLRADDPDAPIADSPCGWRIYFERPAAHDSCYDGLPATGSFDQVPGRVVVERTHVYGSPGERSILGVAESSESSTQRGPYADSAFAVLTITVRG